MNIDTAILDEFSRFVSKSAAFDNQTQQTQNAGSPTQTLDAKDPISGHPEPRVFQTGALSQDAQPNRANVNSTAAPTSNAPYKKIKF